MSSWQKPQLLVITRGRPEERVLEICKAGGGGTNPGGQHLDCVEWVKVECLICYDAATS